MNRYTFRVMAALASFVILSPFLNADAQTKVNIPAKKSAIRPQTTIPMASGYRTRSGLTIIITKRGSGLRPKFGQLVSVQYTGTFTNGIKFDSSRDREKPIEFKLGKGQVIKGWDEAIARLRIGDEAILIIPPSLAYGSKPGKLIPANSTLIFFVELVGAEIVALPDSGNLKKEDDPENTRIHWP